MSRLDQLKIGDKALIDSIISGALASKLTEMGLYPGKQISVLFKAPFGDPLAIQVGDYTLSLRKEEAALIEVTTLAGK